MTPKGHNYNIWQYLLFRRGYNAARIGNPHRTQSVLRPASADGRMGARAEVKDDAENIKDDAENKFLQQK